MDRNTILVCIAIIAVIITGILIFAKSNSNFTFPTIFGMSDKEIGNKVISYINDNKLSQTPASLVSVSEVSGLAKVKIKIGTSSFDSYATKDGKLLFPQAFDMSAKKAGAANQNSSASKAATPAPTAVQKTDSPMLEGYIVSSCPYGLQMQRAFAEAVKNSPALASSVKMRYIGSVSNGTVSSMHGPEEAQENLRQICIRDEQPNKYWSYVSCYMKKSAGTMANGMPLGDSKGCQASTGVDTAKLNSCVSDPKRGVADAQKDFDLSDKYNVQGSPTLILNGTQVSESSYGGRSADAVRAMVCAGSKTQSSFCSQKLNIAEASVSFSATYANSNGGAAANTNCAPAAQ
ncbi:MAG: thioredoxin domain-containing protein [Candidatus Staskawiczbacteria bacterium]|nr:thioredoxin domain-containing protein [Candidatus Staskawiczbacteria bacterium]